MAEREAWPPLPLSEWHDTYATLHMWTQIVGKVRLALSPHLNHWWEVPLYVTARGLTTSPMPYGADLLEIQFDFLDHVLRIARSTGTIRTLPLTPQPVSAFHRDFMGALREVGTAVEIWPMPVEVPDPVRFDLDTVHQSYDADAVRRFWRILATTHTIFTEFRARFIGKSSPVHFFWGSFDLAVTRFSGRRAPERPGADRVTREAYSHEVSSVGFWPGSGPIQGAAFYAYAAPEPAGFSTAAVRPSRAFYSDALHEFVVMYEDIRQAESPRDALLAFCQSTYQATATLAGWDRGNLEWASDADDRRERGVLGASGVR
jgi:hypothetical protein